MAIASVKRQVESLKKKTAEDETEVENVRAMAENLQRGACIPYPPRYTMLMR